MLTLRQMFLSKSTSPVLLMKWRSPSYSISENLEHGQLWWIYPPLSPILAILLFFLDRVDPSFAPMGVMLGTMSLLAGAAVLWGSPMRFFLKDCQKLCEYLPNAGIHGEGELIQRAQEKLAHMAMEVVINERGGQSLDGGAARKRFGAAHSTFSKFNLTESNGWEPYFERARTHIKLVPVVEM